MEEVLSVYTIYRRWDYWVRCNTFHQPIRIGGIRLMLLSGLEAVPHIETLREYYEEEHTFLIMFRSSKRQFILGKNWA